eukprot:2822575-Heterocapsa_arctica.AAC.1
MAVASEGMLTKQLGGDVAEAVGRIVEAIAAGSPEVAGLAARAWASFFGKEENKAQASEWKEKDKDWDVFIRIALGKGAGIAHKLAPKVYVQRMTLVQGPDGELSSTPQAELQQQ